MDNSQNWSAWKSRKSVIFLILTGIATVALFRDVAQFSEWTSFMEWLYVAYIVGNISSKVVTKGQSDVTSTESVTSNN